MNEKQLNQDDVNALLDRHSDSYDAATLSRLRQAREAALLASDKKPMWFTQPLPAAFAVISMLALGILLTNNVIFEKGKEQPQLVNEDRLDEAAVNAFLSNDIDMEFYENIEFYEWLDKSNAG